MESIRIQPRSSRRRRSAASAVVLLIALAAAGCGGGGGATSANNAPATPAPPAPETLFTTENRWTAAVPADSETVTPAEFRRLKDAGEIELVTSSTQQTQKTDRESKVEADRTFLESKTDLSPDVTALIAESRAATGAEAGPLLTLSDGRIIGLIDVGSRIMKAAENYRLSHDPAAVLASYQLSYSLLSDELRAQVTSPTSLTNSTLDEIKAAKAQLNIALEAMVDLDGTRLDPEAPVAPQSVHDRGQVKKPTAGNGMDTAGVCAATGLAQRYWFPLRNFVSPIKNQGSRGTCWAFAAVAATESRERVQNNNAADLAEQFLVNKVKREWFADEFNDGGSASAALNGAVDRNQLLPAESDWTYNTATSRPANAFDPGVAGTAASYSGACIGYTGTCSESAHQSRRVCTSTNGQTFCGYDTMAFAGPGVGASRVRLIWSNGDAFDLNQYRALLSSGVSLIASFPVYEGLRGAPATGLVSNYDKKMLNAKNELVDGTYGGHLVQVVGFITNEQLSFPGSAPSAVGGGGYFIIRNSWGCQGDGGYYYVPADYVSTLFSSLEALDFDARRSTQWNDDQAVPGGAAGLTIDPKGTAGVDLRVQKNIADLFTVAHPTANYARLTVTSDRDGVLFDGQWLMNAPVGGSLFANSLPVNFQTEGSRTLTLTARYGTQVVTKTKGILVLNSPPTIELEGTNNPQQGENFVVNAIVTDRNEANPTAICNAMTWSVTAPDTIVSGSGCDRVIRFGATGAREVRVASQDREGRAGSAIATFTVAPPPANPYPRVTGFGVYSRDEIRAGDLFVGCTNNQVATNAVIDLRQLGCTIGIAQKTRYLSQLTIENPDSEVISYDWTYAVYAPGASVPAVSTQARTSTPSFDLQPTVFGFRDTAYRCTVDVRVNAPEATRNKSFRVWSGQCIQVEDVPR